MQRQSEEAIAIVRASATRPVVDAARSGSDVSNWKCISSLLFKYCRGKRQKKAVQHSLLCQSF